MDYRAVSHRLKSQCEEAALQWMSDNFSRPAMQRRYQRLNEENRGQERVGQSATYIDSFPYHSTPPNHLPDLLARCARKLSSFTFTIGDAVWLVQQCRRWQANGAGSDPSTYKVSAKRAEIAYGLGGYGRPFAWCRGIPSLKLMNVAAELFATRGHADQWAQQLREGETQRRVEMWAERKKQPE
jgi:hypothetical protein